jgi:predicted nucleic acid-binding protein
MTIFIDTNILLSFYQLSRNDLEQLKKLVPLIRHGKNRLILTDQVVDEFYRNRERVIAQTLAELRKGWGMVELPSICRQFSECAALENSVKEASKHRNQLLNHLNDAIRDHALTADLLIREIFTRGTACPATSEIMSRANHRMFRGNPPGKGKSLGDAINWESLLTYVAQDEDLHILSADGDFASDLDNAQLSQFLTREWKKTHTGQIHFYRCLSSFFDKNFRHIKLADQLHRELLISNLLNSPTFAVSRAILREMAGISDFSSQELNAIVTAAITNNQIYWIACDPDIRQYLNTILAGKQSLIEHYALEKLTELMKSKSQP